MTSSYSSKCLRIPKLFSSTLRWARSMLLLIRGDSMTSPSFTPNRSITLAIRSLANRRINLSSRETKNTDEPGSPCRPARPRNCLSTRRLSWRSVPIMAKPPASLTSGDNLISVPRPAIFVAMVTAPKRWPSLSRVLCPANATMSASFWWSLALSTWWGILLIVSIRLNNSDISTLGYFSFISKTKVFLSLSKNSAIIS